jgi:alpha-galactosidase
MPLGRRELLQGALGGAVALAAPPVNADTKRPTAALTPPMGWNSWDCFGASVREDEVKANADYMATHLRPFGWEYIVVDIQWYEPTADSSNYHAFAKLDMDKYGRLVPSVNRFPSAAGGKGFAPLARYCHERGLKFGIHILRGIPRQAVQARTPIFGSKLTAADVADTRSVCPWNTDMYGVDTTKPGSQAWYDSLIQQYKAWGVDFIKVDDLSSPYHKGEIEQIRNAIDRYSPRIVFSTSPGETPVGEAAHIETHANMWRISGDFWDRWDALKHAFDLCAVWQGHAAPGHWPDADMLPLGHIGLRSSENGHTGRQTLFTRDEQRTMLTLWCMARSPLMFGGHLPDNDDWTLSLLTNRDVLDIPKTSRKNQQDSHQGNKVMWSAQGPGETYYLALFNLGETAFPAIDLIGIPDFGVDQRARDLWTGQEYHYLSKCNDLPIPPHGTLLLRLTPA